jgi:hypothetical protein
LKNSRKLLTRPTRLAGCATLSRGNYPEQIHGQFLIDEL